MKPRPAPPSLLSLTALLTALVLANSAANAEPVTFSQGDMLLGFHKDGVDNDVVINIGQASLYRDTATNLTIDVGNLGTLLSDTFGANWYDDPTLQWTVVGSPILSDSSQFEGDPLFTTYITQARTNVNTRTAPFDVHTNLRGSTASRIQHLQEQFMLQDAASGNAYAVVWDGSLENGPYVDWEDTIAPNGLMFGVFDPLVVSGSSPSGIDYPGTALDLYRLVYGMSGTNGVTYEGTFQINSSGSVIYIVPEPSRALLLGFGLSLPLWRRRRQSHAPVAPSTALQTPVVLVA